MANPYRNLGARSTPQSEPIPGAGQMPNSAGGHAWAIDDWARLRRFLILGSDGGTYYVGERKLTLDNAACVRRCLHADGPRLVATIEAVSDSGAAPKNDPAILALALALGEGDAATKATAAVALPKVCRTGTHLFQFVEAVEQFRGWGPALRKAVARWYLDKDADRLAYQLVKYRQREGWTHRDVLRLAHPKALGPEQNALLRWAAGKATPEDARRPLIQAFEAIQTTTAPGAIAALVREHRLPREAVPTDALILPEVWAALLDAGMPLHALVRNLGNMTRLGFLGQGTDACREVVRRLDDAGAIHKSRLHPIAVLIGMLTYASGHGLRGKGAWVPVPQIVDALDRAFYTAFANVEPTGKRIMLALDVSGSMDENAVAGVFGLTPRVASSALAMVTAAAEKAHAIVAFTSDAEHPQLRSAGKPGGWWSPGTRGPHAGLANGVSPVDLSPRMRLDDVRKRTAALPMGGTDCALPMLYALDKGLSFDAFVIYTDNETWAGGIHPAQAIRQYRERTGIRAKLVVVGMTATEFSIADPKDAGMLDVVGFDASAPAVIADFVRQ